MFNILICIDSRVYRDGLCQLLSADRHFGTIHSCASLEDADDHLPDSDISVVLIDVSNCTNDRSQDGFVYSAFNRAGHCSVVVLGLDDDDQKVLALLEAGAAGCVTRDQSIDELIAVVQAAARNELLCSPRVTRRLQERLCTLSRIRQRVDRIGRLSRQEQSVVGFLERCMSNKQIARELGLEVSTVKNHVHNILVKLRVSNRSEAAALVRAIGDLEPSGAV
jgi:two-component system nitrate/nitrite response regulator NarL